MTYPSSVPAEADDGLMAALPDCPACQGTGLVTDEEYDDIVAALQAAESADE